MSARAAKWREPSKAGVPKAARATASARVRPNAIVPNPRWQRFATAAGGAPPSGAATAPLEHEADRVTDAVMRDDGITVQRMCAGCAEGEQATVRRQSVTDEEPDGFVGRKASGDSGGSGNLSLAPGLARQVEATRRGGEPLPPATCAFFEPRLGRDLGDVRIHRDTAAARAASALAARAYTVGADIAFARGQYQPGTPAGRRLLAHELTHVAQQTGPTTTHSGRPSETRVQRQEALGPAARPPADWAARVQAATTSTQRAGLVQEATGVTTEDRTAETRGDAVVTAAHLVPYDFDRPRINYDDGLNRKTSPQDGRRLSANAGYTLRSNNRSYVVLGPLALDADSPYPTRQTLSHEFDHVMQYEAGSTLRGNESEVDAWTSGFGRDFHRTYVLGRRGSDCHVASIQAFAPLLDYYVRSDVSDAVREAAVERISRYYRQTVAPHPAHRLVFRFWIHRSLKRNSSDLGRLPRRLNEVLGLAVDPNASLTVTRQFPCAEIEGVSFPGPPEVVAPTRASGGRRFGLGFRAGAALNKDARRAALSLGASLPLRSDRIVVVDPIIGAQIIYLPPGGDRESHLAAALAEITLRFRQPRDGFYVDLRGGGYVGLTASPSAISAAAGATAAAGAGYRSEHLELGAEARAMWEQGGGAGDNFLVLGVGTWRF